MTLDSRDSDVARSLIPAAVGGDVPRTRLLARLTAAMDEPWTLTLVSAPAGAGKTRLLTQWAHAIGADADTDVVWLSLQRWDDDLSLLRAALERIDDDRLRAGLERVPDAWSTDTARALARALRATDRRIVIVVDDVHLIETNRLADMLSAFVHAVPGNAHVVLSGRGTRMIPLARRRIAGIALELDNRDLVFTPAEVRTYFRARGVSLSQGEITTVLQRTAGWATGLRLLELAALHDPFVADLPLRGDSPLVVDYFAEEVFVDLDEELSEFLVLTSVPEWFTPELAYRLSRGAPATVLIERLIRLNVLISRSGDEPARYHYHPLLREFLYARLADRGPALRESLEKSAAEWFAQEQEYLPALTHATRSGDGVCISLILRRCGMQLILMGHADEVIAATAQIPHPLLSDPSVQMLIAAAELALGDASPAAAVLASPRGDEESTVFRRWQAGLDLHTAVRRGGIAAALERLDPGLDVITGESQLDTYAFLQAAMGELYIGHLDRAEQFARFAGDHARATDAAAAELQSAAILNTSGLFRGRMHDVLESGAVLDERWHALGEPVNSFYEVTRVWRYWVPYERMVAVDTDRALRTISAVIESSPELAIARGLRAMIALLNVESAADAHAAAVALFENLLPRDDMPLPVHWYAMIGSFAVHAFDRLGEPMLRDRFIAATDPLLGSTGEAAVLRAVAALHDERDECARALLAPVLAGTTRCLLPASMVDAWLVAAGLEARAGRTDEAQSALATALSLAEPEEHIRRFAAAGPAVARLLAARATAATRTRFADLVRDRLADAGVLVDEALTHRERIVLAALSHNATLRQIAQQEYISPNTVKTHVRNIYRKLGVSDRDGVTAAAHALGIE